MKKVVLIDGKNFCHRHHWTHRSLSSRGRPTSVLFGGISGLLSLASRLPQTPFVFVWDGEGKTWRHKLKSAVYKANRGELHDRMKDDLRALHKQLPIFKEFMHSIGFRNFEVPHLEGDDLLGILAKEIVRENWFDKVIIHSSDRDFYQLINKRIKVLKGVKDGKLVWAKRSDVYKEFGVPPSHLLQLRAFTGDKSDNIIPAYSGIGPVTAAQLVAAGVDASVSKFAKLPPHVRRKYARPTIRGTVFEIEDGWRKLHTNYILSHIVTSIDNKHLDSGVRGDLHELFSKLYRESFYRRPKCLTDMCFKRMGKWMMDYELEALYSRRIELWAMP
jgi:5'-3' exonuclease